MQNKLPPAKQWTKEWWSRRVFPLRKRVQKNRPKLVSPVSLSERAKRQGRQNSGNLGRFFEFYVKNHVENRCFPLRKTTQTCFGHNSVKSMNFWVLLFVPYTFWPLAVESRERREQRRAKWSWREWRVGFAFRVASFVVWKTRGRGFLLVLWCGMCPAFSVGLFRWSFCST